MYESYGESTRPLGVKEHTSPTDGEGCGSNNKRRRKHPPRFTPSYTGAAGDDTKSDAGDDTKPDAEADTKPDAEESSSEESSADKPKVDGKEDEDTDSE